MVAINITLPIQIVLRLSITAKASNNATLPSIQNPSVATTTEAPELPSGYVAFPEYGLAYKKFETELNYNAATLRCQEANGQLAVIDSTEKVAKMIREFDDFYGYWIGIHRVNNADIWQTIDGKSTSNLPWADGEPGYIGRCAFLYKQHNGLGNLPCTIKIAYLCEIAWPRN